MKSSLFIILLIFFASHTYCQVAKKGKAELNYGIGLSQPDIIIIDSIQTLVSPYIDSTSGSVSQVKECTGELQRFAKETNIPIFIIGHITKEGGIAGPKLLEHIVDVVLQFEGDQHYAYRILRTLKKQIRQH